MYQHPIPQNVTQYEFHLIGSLTIKQFVFAGAGVLIAFVFFKMSFIPVIFRYPLALLFGGGGILIALVPYEGRSLDVWLMNFFKSIYSPTEYIWKKDKKLPDFFSYKKTVSQTPQSFTAKKNTQSKLGDYLSSVNQAQPQSAHDKIEAQKLDQISSLFGENNSKPTAASFNSQSPQNPLSQPKANKPSKPQTKSITKPITVQKNTPATKPNPSPIKKQININPTPFPDPKTPPKNTTSQTKASKPETQPPKPAPKPQQTNGSFVSKAPSIAPPVEIKSIYKDKNPIKFSPEFISDLQIPITAERPNIITGMTINPDEKLIPNAIIEIRDQNNLPVRAIKSNSLSQFSIASPLKDGSYKVLAEHPDYIFDTMEITLNGNILPPIKLIGKSKK